MTREEAIKYFKRHLDLYCVDGISREAEEMAIQALSQEPTSEMVHVETLHQVMWERDIAIGQLKELGYSFGQKIEPCDDAISRILKRMWNCRGKHTTSIDKVAMEQIIRDELPVTQKSGKWILLDECANSGYYCSNCQKKLVKEGWSNTVKKINYCPNCGAKMESEDKE